MPATTNEVGKPHRFACNVAPSGLRLGGSHWPSLIQVAHQEELIRATPDLFPYGASDRDDRRRYDLRPLAKGFSHRFSPGSV
jgi:hypothetical protein